MLIAGSEAYEAERTALPEAALRSGGAPRSLRGIRLLVGWLALRDRASLESVVPPAARCPGSLRTCELVFGVTAAACRSPRVRARLEALLAAHLGAGLLRFAPESIAVLAARFDHKRTELDDDALHALLLALDTHASGAARPLHERVADEIERRRAQGQG